MKTFSTVNSFGSLELVDFVPVKKDMSKSIVDRTNFIPDSEAIKRLVSARSFTAPELKALYDFPDGKDDGRKIPVARMKGVDIAELSQELKNEFSGMEKAAKKAQKRKDQEARLNELSSMSVSELPSVPASSSSSSS